MSVKSFFTKIETTVEVDVEALFNAAEADYEKLEPQVKAALATASGVLAIANKDVNAAPADVWALIQTRYPNVTQESVTAFLIKANNVLNGANTVASNATFAEALTTLSAYLNTLSGNTWITVIKAVVAIAVDVLTPGTVIQKVELISEYVYQNLIKPSVANLTVTPAPAEA